MKNCIQKILIVLALVLSVNSKAQTTVDILGVYDSTATTGCTVPYTVGFSVYGWATGYIPGIDLIELHCFWGDGTDTIAYSWITPASPDYFQSFTIAHTYSTPGYYNVLIIASGPDGTSDTMINSPFILNSGCTAVSGYCYEDNNSNCLFDSGDNGMSNVPIYISDASGNNIGFGYTDINGYYIASIQSGLTGLQISLSPSLSSSVYSSICPSSGYYTFNSTSSTANFDFAVECLAGPYDLFTLNGTSNIAAPGTNGNISFFAGNYSCTSVASIITLTLDPNISYVSMLSGPAPTSVIGNILTWNTSLLPSSTWLGSFSATLEVYTSTTATILSSACFNLSVAPTSSDVNSVNNNHDWCSIINGPYDPNSKEVSPAGIGATGEIAPNTELTYTINFQNTGTAPAINVYLMDTISNNLDMSTFQIVASSHSMNPYFYEGNIIRFDYPNIMLPDSNANEPLSHGWVIYKIKTKVGLTNGTQIKNTGHIFFDYNTAIVTNTTLNTINTTLSVLENKNELKTLIYPNPSSGTVTLSEIEKESTIEVFNVLGEKVISVQSQNTSVDLNLSELENGIYFVKVSSGKGVVSKKIVKE